MCVLAFAWNAHPRWRLVMAGNRDEMHDRPAAPLAHWEAMEHVIAGRDLQAGGTWAGVSAQGRFAVVTNLRGYGTPQPGMASRGALVADLLAAHGGHDDPMAIDPQAFNPFNLIIADPAQARFLTNRPVKGRFLGIGRARVVPVILGPGLYGLSNGAFDAPWPKTVQLKAAMQRWLAGDATDPAALLDVLKSETLLPVGASPAEPSDIPQEAAQSPIFIRNPVYGTRCSTVVAIDKDGNGQIIEQRFDERGGPDGQTGINFRWPPLITLASDAR